MVTQNTFFEIKPIQAEDITAVNALEQAAYGDKWSHRDYNHELHRNALAHNCVLHLTFPSRSLVGHAGFWLLADELHISTIAVQPEWRGLGLGEWLLLHLIEQGQPMGATLATLEVRLSNQVAISLYQKYGFAEVGRRPRYYSDGEDALLLTTRPLASPDYQAMLAKRKTALRRRLGNLQIDKINRLL